MPQESPRQRRTVGRVMHEYKHGELKSGTELRIYKKDAKQPLLVKMDEATDESLLVVLKNEQVSIPKDQIDRIDYRPTRTGGRVITENKTATVDPWPGASLTRAWRNSCRFSS